MARCTAPKEGHRTASGRANCPVCGQRGRYGGGYSSGYRPIPSYSSSWSSGGVRSSSGTSRRSTRAPWSGAGSSQLYTPEEVSALRSVRATVEKIVLLPEHRQIFLCHAWDDRHEAARELNDLLVASGVSVWFSETSIKLGEPFLRAIDKGLAMSQVGIVLVTPALLERLPAAGVADKELSALLARDQLVPIVHNTTYAALRNVSPMLASRNGLDTAEMPMTDVAAKLAELVALENDLRT